ncbi:MAG: glycosyltransferase family 4 protein [Chitinophagaceae bacterium]
MPVIATSVGGIPELVSEENGILVASKDEAALTSAMQFMVSSSEKFDRKK